MSRLREHEVSSPISLFPFIGILLCTMGALLVVLVAVSRSARDTAQEHIEANRTAAKHADGGLSKQIEMVHAYTGSLGSARQQAEHKLHEEHQRLSHVEDHIRRLQERLRSVQTAAVELDALEKDHLDDRAQAERELGRLNELVSEAETTIGSLQEEAQKAPASYAVVPYEGPNGTFRRPMYVECVKEGVILQPEGVLVPANDLLPPYGAGNPLASTLRASRDYYVRLIPKEGQNRDTEPYPLLLVRPAGLVSFDRARQAIEAGDFDLGFELVEDDWKLKFPQPDINLASIQQVALQQARARQEVLAAAAPRAYRGSAISADERYGVNDDEQPFQEAEDDYGEISTNTTANGASPPTVPAGVPSGVPSGVLSGVLSGVHSSVPSGVLSGVPASAGSNAPPGAPSSVSPGVPSSIHSSGSPGVPASAGTSGPPNAPPSDAPRGVAPGSPTASDLGAPTETNSPRNVSVMAGGTPAGPGYYDANAESNKRIITSMADSRGNDWALRQKPQHATPVRRTIRIVVRNDQLTIMSDGTPSANAPGKSIPFQGDTVLAVDELVKHVRNQIDGWGMAGDRLYWRPVLLLSVAPDGPQRARDLQRLLRNSGLEVRIDDPANPDAQPRKNP
ncbi:MAG: hypothetical protein IT425_08890 [Pirellulales bacterium]|nr:hypothetical protein [Pirellulales bacterium]